MLVRGVRARVELQIVPSRCDMARRALLSCSQAELGGAQCTVVHCEVP